MLFEIDEDFASDIYLSARVSGPAEVMVAIAVGLPPLMIGRNKLPGLWQNAVMITS